MAFLEIGEISSSPAVDLKVNVCNAKLSDKRIEKAGKKACVLQWQGRAGRLFPQPLVLMQSDSFDLRDVPAGGVWLLKL